MTARAFASGAYGAGFGSAAQVAKGMPNQNHTVTNWPAWVVQHYNTWTTGPQPTGRRISGQLWPRGDRYSP